MAAKDKKTTIVIKKIDGGGAGAHGGSWKVAFADFMTAMMCFFLVMWLLNQTPETKKEIANYFSGPSMLEHDFSSFGAELTLEKLFLDLVNEPLKTAQNFMQPADFTPNIMAMGSRKIVLAYVANELGTIARDVTVDRDLLEFEIPEHYLFEEGSSQPSANFVNVMSKIQAITVGLEDSRVDIESVVFQETVAGKDFVSAQRVASGRKDLMAMKIKSSFEHPSNEIHATATVKSFSEVSTRVISEGSIRLRITQKQTTADGHKNRPLEDLFDKGKGKDLDVYSDFVKRVSQKSKDKPAKGSRK